MTDYKKLLRRENPARIVRACLLFLLLSSPAGAQPGPVVTSWILNATGTTGYGGIPSNVQQVQYSANNVYVSCTCIPSYNIGPWPGNPNTPVNQNFVYKITRFPQQNAGTPVATPLGHVGVWANGVSIFNAKDAFSYNNQNIWNQNAVVSEGTTFDNCLGHPAPNGEYHHHLNPTCLYDDTDSTQHAPIIGYAFDGYPVYGAYGYDNPNGTGGIRRMETGYAARNITQRTSLPDGTNLNPSQYGPPVGAAYPLGTYVEDFEFTGLGDLDEHNGRWCVTPEYPAGTYAYFVTLDASLDAVYPYTLGPDYYGTVPPGNTGPGSGHNTVNEPVVVYTSISENDVPGFSFFPNPSPETLYLVTESGRSANLRLTLRDATGASVRTQYPLQPAVQYTLDVRDLPAGMYFLELVSDAGVSVRRVVVAR